MTPLDAALLLASKGWHVFPVKVAIPNGKKDVRPIGEWRAQSTADEVTIRGWYTGTWSGAGVAVDCAKSGLVVVDADMELGIDGVANLRGLDLPPARLVIATPGGGQHHYYAADPNRPVHNSTSALAARVDVRGDGGFVFGPGSTDPRGTYEVAEVAGRAADVWQALTEVELTTVPDYVIDHQEKPKPDRARQRQRPQFVRDHTGERRQFTRAEAAKFVEGDLVVGLVALRAARNGERNSTLNVAAKMLSHFMPTFWTDEQAVTLLVGARDDWDDMREVYGTIQSAFNSSAGDWVAEPRPEPEDPKVYEEKLRTDDPDGFWASVGAQDGDTPPAATAATTTRPRTAPTERLATLPEDFWSARAALKEIRTAAIGRGASPDVVYHSFMARLSAAVSHHVKVDNCLGRVPLNYFTAIVGDPGIGKSSSFSVARHLLDVPSHLELMDEMPLGTGEGIAELYMDEVPLDPTKPPGKNTKTVRQQTKHNVFIVVDEGVEMTAKMQAKGSIVGSTLRTAWSGGTFGSANATKDRFRVISEGTYALGMAVGFQRATAAPLLADHLAGTPQRFMWAPTYVELPEERPQRRPSISPIAVDWRMLTGPITMVDSIEDELYRQNRERKAERLVVDPLDAHKPMMLAKIAGLLAILEGRMIITEDDWSLAEVSWNTSALARDALIGHIEALGRDEQRRHTAARASEAVFVQQSLRNAADDQLVKVAVKVAKAVHAGKTTRKEIRRDTLASGDRPRFDEAVELAVDQDWIVVIDEGAYGPGGSQPS